MHTRTAPRLNVSLSEVGLGCWQFGGDWGPCGDDDALATLHAAADAGVNCFDTADVYGSGRSESLIGRFLKERRGPHFVATKLGRGRGYPDRYSCDLLRECTEASIQRLGVESIDLMQLHCVPTEVLRRGEVFDWMCQLQRQGKVKAWGASVESVEEAMLCLDTPGLASLQIIFNVFRQKPIGELLPAALARGVAIIVRLPLASGLLSGRFTPDTRFTPQDHRTYNRDGAAFNVGETFAGLPFDRGVALADTVRPLLMAEAPAGVSMAQAALRWILDHDAVTTVIPGAKSPDQMRANAAASDLTPLSQATHQRLAEVYRDQVAAHIRGPY